MSESSFVSSLLNAEISFPWKTTNKIACITELRITHNRVDIVFFEETKDLQGGFIVAVEAKIKDWRKAIRQSYRNRLFADRVYVALPSEYASSAITNIAEFRRASVGLIVLDRNEVAKIYHHPPLNRQKSSLHSARAREALIAVSS